MTDFPVFASRTGPPSSQGDGGRRSYGVVVEVAVDAPSGVVVVELRVVVGVVVELVVDVLVEVGVLLVVGVEVLVLVLALVLALVFVVGGGVVDTWVVGGVECDELELDLPESPLVTA
jgi:hypothetical protein